MVVNAAGLGPENDFVGEGQQQLQTTNLSSGQRGYYIMTMTVSVQVGKQLLVVSLKGLAPRQTDWR
jgi:hypothetical protein